MPRLPGTSVSPIALLWLDMTPRKPAPSRNLNSGIRIGVHHQLFESNSRKKGWVHDVRHLNLFFGVHQLLGSNGLCKPWKKTPGQNRQSNSWRKQMHGMASQNRRTRQMAALLLVSPVIPFTNIVGNQGNHPSTPKRKWRGGGGGGGETNSWDPLGSLSTYKTCWCPEME